MEIDNVNVAQQQDVKTNKNSLRGTLAATAGGLTAYAGLQLPPALYSIRKMSKLSTELPADTVQIINNAADKALRGTGLARKGVKIVAGGIGAFWAKNVKDKYVAKKNAQQ